MTEKRFTSDIHRIFDNDEEIACADTMDDAETIVDILNEQEELIKRLKQIREEQTETILKQKRKIRELELCNQGKYIYGIRGGSND